MQPHGVNAPWVHETLFSSDCVQEFEQGCMFVGQFIGGDPLVLSLASPPPLRTGSAALSKSAMTKVW